MPSVLLALSHSPLFSLRVACHGVSCLMRGLYSKEWRSLFIQRKGTTWGLERQEVGIAGGTLRGCLSHMSQWALLEHLLTLTLGWPIMLFKSHNPSSEPGIIIASLQMRRPRPTEVMCVTCPRSHYSVIHPGFTPSLWPQDHTLSTATACQGSPSALDSWLHHPQAVWPEHIINFSETGFSHIETEKIPTS